MFLKYRPARPADFSSRVTSVRDAFAYNDQEQGMVVSMWKDLLAKKQMHCPIIEDCTPGTGLGCVFLCNIVFIDDAFARYLQTDAPPISSKYLLELWQAQKLPFLTEKQLRTGNSTNGVNVLILASGVALEAIQSGLMPLIGSKLLEYHPYALNGFRLNGVYLELYDEFGYNWAETFGYLPLTEYENHYQDRAASPIGQSPRLYGIDSAQATKKLGAPVTMMFHYQSPRFGFKVMEQELLLWALSGDTDEQLSNNLNLSSETIKKRWRQIYARVRNVSPDIFGPTDDLGSTQRGLEKKRNLLAYLHHHMEELRPYDPELLNLPKS